MAVAMRGIFSHSASKRGICCCTGDEHVPAGHVSFRARARSHPTSDDPAVLFPPQMDVVHCFQGQGCVAENGHAAPQWCAGQLLAFGTKQSPQFQRVTGGAGLGFMWSMVHSKRFLILLTRAEFDLVIGKEEEEEP
jgi:hypothetical protein